MSSDGIKKPFIQRLRRAEHRPASLDVKPFVRSLKENGYNLLVSSGTVGGGWAYFPSKIRPAAEEMDPDYVRALLDECHANDIMVITWFCFNIEDVYDINGFQPAKLYPDCVMEFINPPEGERDAIGMCMFTSDYRKHQADFLQEIIALGFDGVWFDGTSGAGMPNRNRLGCVCPTCRQAFREDTGVEIPGKIDWTDEVFRRWVVWRYDRLLATFRFLADKVHEVNPNAVPTFSESNRPWGPGQWFLDWKFAQPLTRHSGYVLSAHSGLGPTACNQYLPLHAKLVGSAAETADIWSPVFPTRESPNTRRLPPQAFQARMHALGAIAHGVIPWFGAFPDAFPVFADINAAVAPREAFFGGERVRHAGVVASTRARDFWGEAEGRVGVYSESLYGIHSSLAQHHVEMSFLFDSDLDTGNLDGFAVLILPDTACLSDQAAENLDRWVAAGGRLIATHETSLRDEWGRPRDDFALAGLLGVSFVEAGADDDPNEWIAEPVGDELADIGKVFSFDAPFVRVRVTDDAVRVLAKSDDDAPVVTLRPHGKGEAVYIAAEPGIGYTRWPHLWTRRIIARLARRRPLPYEVEAPTVVISNGYLKDDPKQLLVHLLNLPYASNRVVRPGWPGDPMASPGARPVLDELVPVHDIRVGVRGSVASAELPLSGRALEIEREGDMAWVTVPRLDDHEIVRFVLAD